MRDIESVSAITEELASIPERYTSSEVIGALCEIARGIGNDGGKKEDAYTRQVLESVCKYSLTFEYEASNHALQSCSAILARLAVRWKRKGLPLPVNEEQEDAEVRLIEQGVDGKWDTLVSGLGSAWVEAKLIEDVLIEVEATSFRRRAWSFTNALAAKQLPTLTGCRKFISSDTRFTAARRADGLRASATASRTTTNYYYDGASPVLEENASGTVTAVNDYAPDGLIARTGAETSTIRGFMIKDSIHLDN